MDVEKENLIVFKLKNPGQSNRQIENALRNGLGVKVELREQTGLPVGWESPDLLLVNGVLVGTLSEKGFSISMISLQKIGVKSGFLERLAVIADEVQLSAESRSKQPKFMIVLGGKHAPLEKILAILGFNSARSEIKFDGRFLVVTQPEYEVEFRTSYWQQVP